MKIYLASRIVKRQLIVGWVSLMFLVEVTNGEVVVGQCNLYCKDQDKKVSRIIFLTPNTEVVIQN